MVQLNTKIKRKLRVRRSLKSNNNQRPRLSVFRSSKNIYAQHQLLKRVIEKKKALIKRRLKKLEN